MSFILIRAIPRFAGIAMLAILGACATVPGDVQTPPTAATADRAYHPAIEMAGRLSVRYQRNGNEESMHGSFAWEQTPAQTIVTLLSPLGQTLARIEITPYSATLLQPGQAPRVAQDVDGLTAATLGWPLPVAGLRDWLQGFATSADAGRSQAMPAQAAVINTPDGWRLHFVSWQQEAEAYPRRIDLERHTAQAGEVSLRIVVDRWQPSK